SDLCCENLDRLAVRRQRDHCTLERPTLPVAETRTLPLALAIVGVHLDHSDVEDLLDSDFDLCFVRVRVYLEGVLPILQKSVALLGDHGRDDDVTLVADHFEASSSVSAAGRWLGGSWNPAASADS